MADVIIRNHRLLHKGKQVPVPNAQAVLNYAMANNLTIEVQERIREGSTETVTWVALP